jgi:hypothetical protein
MRALQLADSFPPEEKFDWRAQARSSATFEQYEVVLRQLVLFASNTNPLKRIVTKLILLFF